MVDNMSKTPNPTARQLQIARAYTAGGTYRTIAADLGIAVETVPSHLKAFARHFDSTKIARAELVKLLKKVPS